MVPAHGHNALFVITCLVLLCLVPPASSLLPRCPSLDDNLATEHSQESRTLSFANNAQEAVALFWLNSVGMESRMGEVAAGGVQGINSFVGHAWRLRFTSDNTIVKQFKVEPDQPERVVINQCARASDPAQDTVPEEWNALPWTEPPTRTSLADCGLDSTLSAIPNPGFHSLCILPPRDTKNSFAIAAFVDSTVRSRASHAFDVPAVTNLAELRALVEHFMEIPPRRKFFQPPAFFTARGWKMKDIKDVRAAKMAVLVEGGQWIWPGVSVGHKVVVGHLRRSGEPTVIKTVSLQPKVFEVENFLEAEECDRYISRASPHMAQSGVAYMDHDRGKPVTKFRTSSTHFLSSNGDKLMEKVEARVQKLTRVPIVHAEDTQVLRYEKAQYYHAHHDYFDPQFYQKHAMLQTIQHGANNRFATIFFYLTDVAEGGETTFPRSGGLSQPMDMSDCRRGLQVKPKRNKVIIFYSLLPNGELDPFSLHGGCDVINGTKWSANFWLWNKPYGSRRAGRQSAHYKTSQILNKPSRVLEAEDLAEIATGKDKDEL